MPDILTANIAWSKLQADHVWDGTFGEQNSKARGQSSSLKQYSVSPQLLLDFHIVALDQASRQ